MVIISFWYPHWCTFMIKDLTSPEIIRIGFIQRQTVLDYRLQSSLSIILMKILSGNTNNTHKLINNSFHCQCFFPFVYLSLLDQLCLFNYNCDYHMIKGSCRFSFNRWQQVLYSIDFSYRLLSCFQPQNEHIELHRKRHGYRLDYHERKSVTPLYNEWFGV